MARPVTRFLCRWVPRRTTKRVFTKADAARIICYAVRDGSALEEIIVEAEARCPDPRKSASRKVALEIALAGEAGVAAQSIQYIDSVNRGILDPILKQVLILLGILVAFGIALAVSPVPAIIKRPVLGGLRVAEQSLRQFEGSIIRHKAANDAFIELMREVIVAAKKAA